MDYTKLWLEISLDPENIGYAKKTNAEIADLVNITTGPIERGTVAAYEIIEATEPAEFIALTAAAKQIYQIITGAGTVNIRGPNTRKALAGMFGAGTTTRANLLALQTETQTRATQLGLGAVYPGHVGKARLVGATYSVGGNR